MARNDNGFTQRDVTAESRGRREGLGDHVTTTLRPASCTYFKCSLNQRSRLNIHVWWILGLRINWIFPSHQCICLQGWCCRTTFESYLTILQSIMRLCEVSFFLDYRVREGIMTWLMKRSNLSNNADLRLFLIHERENNINIDLNIGRF